MEKLEFTAAIAPYVRASISAAKKARLCGDSAQEFAALERAHVLGQESSYWHVCVHARMLMWGLRNRSAREVIGQTVRLIGAASKTVLGWVPTGNTGGSNVSPFQTMSIDPALAESIQSAKAGL
ncbi:MAG: DUF3703 domain-containing protein [Pseudomonadota bacterium]